MVEILGSGLPGDVEIILEELDPRVGVPEQVVQQILRIADRRVRPQPLLVVRHQGAHAVDQSQRLAGRRGYGAEHVEQPGLPVAVVPNALQHLVIVRLVGRHIAAEIEHRDVQ
ncbi:hypothetical protein D3C72_2063830 [compost metagenome]